MIVAIQPNTHLSPSVASQLTCAQVTGKPILVIAGNREQARGWQELYPSFKCIGGDSESNMRQAITEFAESLRQAPDQPSGGGQ